MSRSEYLFVDGDLGATLDHQTRELAAAAEAIPPDHALSQGVDELAAELLARFRIEPLEIDWDEMTVSATDTQVDISGDPMRFIRDRRGPFYVPGTTVTYHIPFRGDANLFKLRPSTFRSVFPAGEVVHSELRISVVRPADAQEGIKESLDREVGTIKWYVEQVSTQVEAFNRGLESVARGAAERRRAKILADNKLIGSFGLPLRRREDAPTTYATPAVRRKIPPRTSPPQSGRPSEPIVPSEEYEHILSVLRGMAHVLERSPKAFVSMGEESLRQHFLVQLNGQYEGKATGETFNFEGKTDILVRDGDRNVFIGECKFWKGPKHLTETIDQILGYASWRDTKTAILLFNRDRQLTTVLSQIEPTVAAHPNFVRQIPYGDETESRFILRHRDDPGRELTLTVLAFDVPA